MFKFLIVVAMLAFASASPLPRAAPKAKPQLYLDPYLAHSDYVAPVAYSAPLAYSDYVVPSVYAADYAYSPYVAAEPVVVY